MNKTNLVYAVKGRLEKKGMTVTHRQCTDFIDSMIVALRAGIQDEDRVAIPEFGVFTKVQRKARTARNPRTGETVEVPEKTTVKFKPSQYLKDMLNG